MPVTSGRHGIPEDDLGDYLVSSRSLREYRAMFDLTPSDLEGRVLDCPGGAASLVAEVNAVGGHAVAVDPVYALAPDELVRLALEETARASDHTAAHAHRYTWAFYGDLDGHRRTRTEAATRFVADLLAHPASYVEGSLPNLPLPDQSFDLAVSSHFLFTYADRLDVDFHVAAIRDLTRVAREVRVYPLVHHTGALLAELTGEVASRLAAQGVSAQTRPVPYRFQPQAALMLVAAATRGRS